MNLFDEAEFQRWLAQSEQTLKSAERDQQSGDYNWACFKAQQAAEYAIKGLLRGVGQPGVGHSVLRFLEEWERLSGEGFPAEKDDARLLDRHYIPTRYVDAHPAGSPFEYYRPADAAAAVEAAQRLVEFVRTQHQAILAESPEESHGGASDSGA